MTGSLATLATIVATPNLTPGAYVRRYVGYCGTNDNFFKNLVPYSQSALAPGPANPFIYNIGSLDLNEAYSYQWLGYFRAPTTGTYNLQGFLSYTDAFARYNIWWGPKALKGQAEDVFLEGTSTKSTNLNLTAGTLYPYRIQACGQGNPSWGWYGLYLGSVYFEFVLTNRAQGIVYNTLTGGF